MRFEKSHVDQLHAKCQQLHLALKKRSSTASHEEPDHITEFRESQREPISAADSQKKKEEEIECNHNKDPYLPGMLLSLTKT